MHLKFGGVVEKVSNKNYILRGKYMKMKFKTYQLRCKYAAYGLKQDTVRDFELTCRNPKCVPSGHSWGICDKMHCPHYNYGLKINSGTAMNMETGEVLFKL